ncbi:MAG TPA: hypothetical protein VG010_11230, partial [Solirubrobacteraceae bacterium]|nr:hypothetical protein [Solirubrobacteraceae bacterium]
SGTAKTGQTLTAGNGSWTESPTGYAYQWQRCDKTGANCKPISEATKQTYGVVQADVESTIRVAVTATNSAGPSTPASSAQTAEVTVGPVPVNTALPTITGTAKTGQTLTAGNGTWTESPTGYAYQWQRCDKAGANCAPISEATKQTYGVVQADVGSTLRVAVTASNAAGPSTPASSNQTAEVINASVPINTALPTITGTAKTGQTLTAGNGTWTESPTGYAYQWQRCDKAGANCAAISEATKQTYLVAQADVESTLRVAVTATNSAGPSAPASSNQTAEVINASAPANTALPTITGTAKTGQTLTAGNGSWTESPTGYAYQWQRCDIAGANCKPIAEATKQTYGLVSADLGSTIRVTVTAANSAGKSSPATSGQTAEVTSGLVPANTAPPTVSGTPSTGQTLTASTGAWSENPTSFEYQWQRCDKAGANCAAISEATKSTYALGSADLASTIRVTVTARNAVGPSEPATSGQTAEVQQGTFTFGKTTVGAFADTFTANRKRVNRYALGISASVSKLTMYLTPTKTSGQQVLKGIIYADSGGKPAALLATSNQLTFKSTNAAGWYELTFSTPPVLAAGNYWIGVISGTTSGVTGFRYDKVTGSRDYNANTYTSGPSNPFGAVSTDAEQASLYATYSPH